MMNLVCPVSPVRIDRNVVRTNGAITTLGLLAYAATGSVFLILPIALDYVLRASMNAPKSPMARFAALVASRAGLPYRAMDKAPKVFASRIGVSFAMAAAIAHFFHADVAIVLALTLSFFTFLESALDFCVGCVVYTYIALPLRNVQDALFGRAA